MKLNMTETFGEKVKDVAGFGKSATSTFLFFDINGTVIVERFSKLLNYTDKEVSFISKGKQVYIYGNDLTIMYFSKSEMTIEGNIEKIEIFEV